MESYLLAGDIGGTKTILALFATQSDGLPITAVKEKVYPSDDYPSLEAIVRSFIQEERCTITAASFGVAGPVVNQRAQITNLPWVIQAEILQEVLDIEAVTLLNDLEAIANAVPYLKGKDTAVLNQGEASPQGAIAVIAPGTGLGEAFLVWNGTRYESYPSEGGHASFSPTTPLQMELLTYLSQKIQHVSFERVCSGSGIPNLYHFLLHSGRYSEPDWLRQQINAAEDPTPVIFEAALTSKVPLCCAVVELFIEILASETANMALKIFSTGGIYLGGGIPPRIVPQLQQNHFIAHFTQKGRFKNLLSQMPVHVILNPKAALYGAAYQGMHRARET